MKYRAIITDLDGTAVDSPDQKQASQRLRTAVENLERHGIKVCAATGRAISFAKPILTSMGLSGPAIVAGGTKVIDSQTFKELWSYEIPSEAVNQLKKLVPTLPYGCLWNDYTEDDYLNGGWRGASMPADIDLYFFELVFVPEDEVPEVIKKLTQIPDIVATVVVAQRQGMKDIHITNARATKEHAIQEVEAMIHVPKEQMIGVGDGHNDLHIYNAVGHRVAMANAVPELKEAADEVIESVRDEGLAKYFERLLDEKRRDDEV